MSRLLDNRYKLIRSLAGGGFGATFLAADLRLPSERLCVVKQLKLDTTDPNLHTLAKARFTREAVVLEELGHHHRQIPQLYAYFEEAGEFYLVQEYIEGQTLTQQIKSGGPWNEAQVHQLLLQLLPVLTYIHGKGIIHRDIKPDNIILQQHDGLPVLIDFGAVKEAVKTNVSMSGQPQPSVIIGTTGFMPPEQATGHPMVSSDLYALGLTAIYSLTGQLPQNIEDNPMTGELYWQALTSPLSDRFVAVLNQVIRPIPKDRFSSAQAMQRALGDALQPQPQPQPLAPQATAPTLPPPPAPAPTLPPIQNPVPAPIPATLATRVASPLPPQPASTPLTSTQPAAALPPDQGAPIPIQTDAPSQPISSTRGQGCRWVLWAALVIAIALTSGTLSFALKRRSILFFSHDDSEEVNPIPLSVDVARATVEDFYRYVSAKEMVKARELIGGSLAEQLDPNSTFFQQFDQVSVAQLTITGQTDTRIDLTGLNTYYYPDGTTQEEERTFSVTQAGADPQIVASEFVRVTRPRQ